MGQRYPAPITVAMLTPANPRAGYPRYGTPADWAMGAVGNDIDVAQATVAVVGASGAGEASNQYTPRNQTGKGAFMTPPMTPLSDFGKDYGIYADATGRDGWTEPFMPYGPKPVIP